MQTDISYFYIDSVAMLWLSNDASLIFSEHIINQYYVP